MTQEEATELLSSYAKPPMVPVIIRAAVETDFGFLFDSFLKGSKISYMRYSVYNQRYAPVIKALINRCNIAIACLASDPNTIAAFVIYETLDNIPIIHYIHTRSTFIRQGIATKLIKECVNADFTKTLTMSSHQCHFDTLSFKQLMKRYRIEYDPFLATTKEV